MPSFSHDRITEAEIPVNSATSPMVRCPREVVGGWGETASERFCRGRFNDSLDKQEVDSLTLRNYSKVAFSGNWHSFALTSPIPLFPSRGSMLRFAIRFCASVSLAALFALCCSVGVWAQSTGGRINGRVTDPSGAVVPDATVTIINEAAGVRNHTQSSKSGDFSFPSVPVGVYTIEFEAPGFKKLTRKQVALDLNQTLTVNGTLELGAATETVEVSSEAPLIDTSST
jgi:hypothetical protein